MDFPTAHVLIITMEMTVHSLWDASMIAVDMECVRVSMGRKGVVHATMDTTVRTALNYSMGVGRTTAHSMRMGVCV